MSFKNFLANLHNHVRVIERNRQAKKPRNPFFRTLPLIITNRRLSIHHIPLVPTASKRIFQSLARAGLTYTLLDPQHLLIQNYTLQAFAAFRACSPQVNITIQRLSRSSRQFIQWGHHLSESGFDLVGGSYIDQKGLHTKFSSRKHHLKPKDVQELLQPHTRFQYLIFCRHNNPAQQLAINKDRSVINFTPRPDLKNTINFVDALFKSQER